LVREESSSAELLIPEPNLPEHGAARMVEIPNEIGKFTSWGRKKPQLFSLKSELKTPNRPPKSNSGY
jgi:hypothetical protein